MKKHQPDDELTRRLNKNPELQQIMKDYRKALQESLRFGHNGVGVDVEQFVCRFPPELQDEARGRLSTMRFTARSLKYSFATESEENE